MSKKISLMVGALFALTASQAAMAACSDVSRSSLETAVGTAAAATTGGYGLAMWATFVDETGKVCHVVTSGTSGATASGSEWLGSRIISAQKANTANAFSLDGYAISTANLYSAVQPGGSLYGLQHSNPVDASRAYGGGANTYGTNADFLKNKRIGGVNVFGGGLALYKSGKKIGAIGVSGDTSCRDHSFAWEIRDALNMEPTDGMTGGAGTGITTFNVDVAGALNTNLTGATQGDELIIDFNGTDADADWGGWEHPACPGAGSAGAVFSGVIEN